MEANADDQDSGSEIVLQDEINKKHRKTKVLQMVTTQRVEQ